MNTVRHQVSCQYRYPEKVLKKCYTSFFTDSIKRYVYLQLISKEIRRGEHGYLKCPSL
jgi:hypothetical protein